MAKKPKQPKAPSMKRVAKMYKKTHEQIGEWSGARMFNSGAKSHGLGDATTKNTYKPTPKQITVGGTRRGKGATIKKRGTA